jgi:hypothetical protein
MLRTVGILLLLSIREAKAAVPSTCVLYFNFSHTEVSDAWFGEASKDGTLTSR